LTDSKTKEKEWKPLLLLTFCCAAIYIVYFPQVFCNFNGLLSSITLDSIKNYYTFAYHVSCDSSWLNFRGMNYPFSEHVVYTDCQPLLVIIVKALPFLHQYLAGIINFLMFFSYIICAPVLFRVLRLMQVERTVAFFSALAITLLSPQFLKINAGHHALAYAFVVPLSLLLQLKYFLNPSFRRLITITLYNLLMFFIHPYFGLSLSVFSLVLLFVHALLNKSKRKELQFSMVPGVFPPAFFAIFMKLTDKHVDRPIEPYGTEELVENTDNILAPVFGPFKNLLSRIFSHPVQHFEGHNYAGLSVILLFIVTIAFLIVKRKWFSISKIQVALLIAGFIFLFISFGWPFKFFHLFGVHPSFLNQFRASCRFGWFFYYVFPVVLIPVMCYAIGRSGWRNTLRIQRGLAAVILALNLVEARGMFLMDREAFWNVQNPFRKNALSEEQRNIVRMIAEKNPQCILPLPLFHGGSEMYDRAGYNNSMIPSMIYSWHSGVPILSTMLSRTSISETEDLIAVMNAYKSDRPVLKKFAQSNILVIKTKDELLPDESRFDRTQKYFLTTDSLSYAWAIVSDFSRPDTASPEMIKDEPRYTSDLIYIPGSDQKPFIDCNMNDYNKIMDLDTGKVISGTYVVSFRIPYMEKNYKSVACNLIITEATGEEYAWKYNVAVRLLSGFYPGYGVFEYRIVLDRTRKYEFILKGSIDRPFHISHFLLRPESKNIVWKDASGNAVINNFGSRE
jgi:hypothetical protein